MESLRNTVIVRNSEGVAILPISSKKGIVGYTLVEDRHWHELSQCGLSLSHGYVQARLEGKNQRVHLYLYRKYVGKIPVGYKIDHSGKDEKDPKLKRLDNRLSNLRAVTNGQNSQNRIVTKVGTSQYQGVCKSRKKWVVAVGGKYVGSFDTEEKAALAYNVKAIEVYGEGAKLNVIIGA
jgi:HNH endonuclease